MGTRGKLPLTCPVSPLPEHVMRPLRYSINVTIDGCCDHRAILPDEELHRYHADNIAQADALLLGRVTYEMMEAAWRPSAAGGCDRRFGRHYPAAERDIFDLLAAGRGRSGMRWSSQEKASRCWTPKNRSAAVLPSARFAT